ncbi:unnamed protein product [Effrenium voratum]|nr:unnamed protein product [Effrenium voratum]
MEGKTGELQEEGQNTAFEEDLSESEDVIVEADHEEGQNTAFEEDLLESEDVIVEADNASWSELGDHLENELFCRRGEGHPYVPGCPWCERREPEAPEAPIPPPMPPIRKATGCSERKEGMSQAPRSLEELRNRCPSRRLGPRHLCPDLCYFREFEPARQLRVLQDRAEAAGLARPNATARLAFSQRPPYWCVVFHDTSGAVLGSQRRAWQLLSQQSGHLETDSTWRLEVVDGAWGQVQPMSMDAQHHRRDALATRLAPDALANAQAHALAKARRWSAALKIELGSGSAANAVMSSCAKSRQWTEAMAIMAELSAPRAASRISFGSAISCAAKESHWRRGTCRQMW